jgi:hypothetical protein
MNRTDVDLPTHPSEPRIPNFIEREVLPCAIATTISDAESQQRSQLQ